MGYLLSCVYLEPVPASSNADSNGPKLRPVERVPLDQWDSLYYAMQADIRELYARLEKDVGLELAAGQFIVHDAGPLGKSSNEPYSALELASQLEQLWTVLNDQHIVARLDQAIRMAKIKSSTRVQFANDQDSTLVALATSLGPRIGLYNTHTASAQRIASMLFKKIDAQFRAELGKPPSRAGSLRLMAAARVDVRDIAIAAKNRKARKVTIPCLCQLGCHCQVELDCGMQRGECPCAYARHEICDLIGLQRDVHASVQKDAEAAGVDVPRSNTILNADTNEEARMQVAGLATADPYVVQMCKNIAEEAAKRDEHDLTLHKSRSRTGMNEIDLAYVPAPKTPGRDAKDPFPLALYNDSPQRYPRMNGGASADAGRAFDAAHMPPSELVQSPRFAGRALTYGESEAPALPSEYAAPSTQVTYPAIPVSQSNERFCNHNDEGSRPKKYDVDIDVPASEYSALANMARQQVNPFTESIIEPFLQSASPEPMAKAALAAPSDQDQQVHHALKPAVRSKIVSDGPHYITRKPVNHQKVRSEPNASKPHPPLPPGTYEPPSYTTASPLLPTQPPPLPPPPRQRWVSAGGTAKLSERPEIIGPPVHFNRIPTTGVTMSKAALFERLNDPDVIEHTMQLNRASTDKRGSAEHREPSTPQPRNSPTRSTGEKRERQDSTGSTGSKSGGGRMAKLKRVFSRSVNSP
nr:hypothetical protein CFP56_09242 [Quercus suber]